jgi:DNA mismatch repair protein MutS
MSHLDEISIKTDSANLQIDGYTLKNLELLSSLSGNKKTSFFSCIDNTKTPMGARLLKEWLLNPSINIDEIVKRQNATNTIIQMALFNKANDTLSQIGDMPRIASRIGTNTIRPRDLIALNQHLKQIPCLLNVFDNANDTYIQEILKTLNPMFDVVTLLENSINEEAGPVFKLGQVIKDKYDSKLDELRNLMHNQSNLLLEIEKREILATKINTLKVKFNKVQGYFIEISKAFAHLAPPHYHRMQTLKNVERYTIEELSRLFQITSTAKASALEIEKELFNEILEKLKGKLQSIYTNAKSIAIIDVLNSYAFLACNNNFVKPCFVKERKLEITKGEHYVVQTQEKDFVPNDCLLDEVHSSMLITGPNMGGKSTYMRQNALIVILAQMGSFVPARKVTLGLFDAVYTRIGASDDLAKGLSTYMVEMTETAYILKNCTKNSLVLIDEIGRGTSTYDGTALAYATLDYISNVKRAFTFFSTHYFELTKDIPKNCINMHFTAIKIPKGKLIFNHLIKPGPASESYGIEVASLAGVPEKVIQLACKKLKQLQQN